eukprot:12324866-Alexandrium_andersonii.AAC.1
MSEKVRGRDHPPATALALRPLPFCVHALVESIQGWGPVWVGGRDSTRTPDRGRSVSLPVCSEVARLAVPRSADWHPALSPPPLLALSLVPPALRRPWP